MLLGGFIQREQLPDGAHAGVVDDGNVYHTTKTGSPVQPPPPRALMGAAARVFAASLGRGTRAAQPTSNVENRFPSGYH